MARQRNNVARMPWEQRRVVNRMLFDGAGYAEIGAELRRQFPGAPRLHNSSLLAWQKGAEYRRYREAREKDQAETEQTRALAEALNDGRGPESLADLTAMEVLRELWRQTRGGQVTELGDLAQVTKALAPILRAQIAADQAASRRREGELAAELERLQEELGKQRSDFEERLRAKDAEIAALRNGGRAVDAVAVADGLNQVLGVKKA